MKLQKLVYMAHGWNLAINASPAIDSHFEAWPYGPVEDDLYHIFKTFRNNPIKEYALDYSGPEKSAYVVNQSKNPSFYNVIDLVCTKYLRFSAEQLSAMTHQQGTPWSQVRANGGGVIPNQLIADHFRSLVLNK